MKRGLRGNRVVRENGILRGLRAFLETRGTWGIGGTRESRLKRMRESRARRMRSRGGSMRDIKVSWGSRQGRGARQLDSTVGQRLELVL